jgi:sugar fermentation stimulation protein A
MLFDPPLLQGRLIRRYKRFFADVQLSAGEHVVAHCPNTGSLLGCLHEGADVLLATAANPKASLRFSWKMVRVGPIWVGLDTGLAVPLVEEALARGTLPALAGYPRRFREVRYGREQASRIDILLSRGGELPQVARGKTRALPEGDERVYIEVKNTTLVDAGVALFPDAVTERGQKHLEELMHVVATGQRAAMIYCVQRGDCASFRPADHIDPRYGKLLRQAQRAGVELYALRAIPGPNGIEPDRLLPIEL